MSFDSILTLIIVPIIFIWLGSRIYKHEKDHIDPVIAKVKGWFTPKEDIGEEYEDSTEYKIKYRGAEY